MTNHEMELVGALQTAIERTRFQVLHGTQVAPVTLSEMYEKGVEGLVGMRDYDLTTSIDDSDPALRALVEALRVAVSDCLDEHSCIGDGVVALMGGGHVYPPIERYARNLLRPGATLGASTVVHMVYGWLRGAPVSYKRQYALANDVSGDPTLTISVTDGLQLSALPLSSQLLYRRFPSLHGKVDARELTGKILLTVECVSGVPGIFRPGFKAPRHSTTVARDFDQDRFCEAMSLAENKSVCWQFTWGDYGVLREFNPIGAGGFTRQMTGWSKEALALSEQKSKKAMTMYTQRASIRSGRLATAIYRWNRAKEPSQAFSNKLIELRIALESLYAADGGPEVTFRQALRGALHLGHDYEDRLRYRELLKKVYGLASRAAHGNETKPKSAHRKLLDEGLDACRAGILKCLAEGGDIDYDKLMFDR